MENKETQHTNLEVCSARYIKLCVLQKSLDAEALPEAQREKIREEMRELLTLRDDEWELVVKELEWRVRLEDEDVVEKI